MDRDSQTKTIDPEEREQRRARSQAELQGCRAALAKAKESNAGRIQALEKRIHAAFAGVSRPAITFRVARAHDDHLPHDQAMALGKLDKEQVWIDVRDEDIVTYQEYFNFSDAEGWRFYLPAFMAYELRHYPGSGYPALDDALVDLDAHHTDKIRLLSPDQKSCVDEFIELMNEAEEIKARFFRF